MTSRTRTSTPCAGSSISTGTATGSPRSALTKIPRTTRIRIVRTQSTRLYRRTASTSCSTPPTRRRRAARSRTSWTDAEFGSLDRSRRGDADGGGEGAWLGAEEVDRTVVLAPNDPVVVLSGEDIDTVHRLHGNDVDDPVRCRPADALLTSLKVDGITVPAPELGRRRRPALGHTGSIGGDQGGAAAPSGLPREHQG